MPFTINGAGQLCSGRPQFARMIPRTRRQAGAGFHALAELDRKRLSRASVRPSFLRPSV